MAGDAKIWGPHKRASDRIKELETEIVRLEEKVERFAEQNDQCHKEVGMLAGLLWEALMAREA